jgi:hypothetical protein
VELEQRVKALEYEIKILKNEIQRTLLDIQEQVLIHYYPSLRSEESSPSEGALQAVEAIRAKQAGQQVANLPAAKKVTLDEIRAHGIGAASAQSTAVAQAGGKMDQATMTKLSRWVSESAAKLGGERTGRLVTACSAKGVLSSEAKEPLLRLASTTKGAAPGNVSPHEELGAILKLDELLGRVANVEEAFLLIEEANRG